MSKVVKLSTIKVYWMEQTIVDHVYEEDENTNMTVKSMPASNTANVTNTGTVSSGPIYSTNAVTGNNYINFTAVSSTSTNWNMLKPKVGGKMKEVIKQKKLALIPIFFKNHIYFLDKLSAYDLYNNVDVTRIGVDKKDFGIYMNRYNKDFDILGGRNFVEKFPILGIGELEFRTFFTEDGKIGAEPI